MEHALTTPCPDARQTGARDRPRLMLLISAGDEHYALDAYLVAEVVASVDLTPLSDAPPGVVGLLNRHGRMVPVVDLCRIRQGRDCQRLLSTRIAMVRLAAAGVSDRLVGLRAEHVTDGVWVDPADLTRGGCGFEDAVYLRRTNGPRTEMIAVLYLERFLPDAAWRRLSTDRTGEA
jgi:chemotaxis-related protein WspB